MRARQCRLPITFFEITTAAAFLAFARAPADMVLLETGLGGRFDATNLIAQPAVTVITPISLDHQPFLGETIAAIAFEKAGILKPGRKAVIGPQPAEAMAVIEARAGELKAPLYRAGREWWVEPTDEGGLGYRGGKSFDLPAPALPGRHQLDNAGAAIAALECLPGFMLDPAALVEAMRQVEWLARLQRLNRGPLVDPPCREIPSSGSTAPITRPEARHWHALPPAGRLARYTWSSACCRPMTRALSSPISSPMSKAWRQ
jgi:dihydrofolate synthase/folylpolyglutamate synthase